MDADLRTRFQEQYPFHNSVSWLLEHSMRELLEATAGSPSLTSLVRASIRTALQENRRSEANDNISTTVEPI